MIKSEDIAVTLDLSYYLLLGLTHSVQYWQMHFRALAYVGYLKYIYFSNSVEHD